MSTRLDEIKASIQEKLVSMRPLVPWSGDGTKISILYDDIEALLTIIAELNAGRERYIAEVDRLTAEADEASAVVRALRAEVAALKAKEAGYRLYLTHIGYSDTMETFCPHCGETRPLRFDTDNDRTWALCSVCGHTLIDSIEYEQPD